MESNEQKPGSQVISLREAIINPGMGVDDRNMAANPMCLLSDRNPKKDNAIKHEWTVPEKNEDGIIVPMHYYRYVSGNAEYGLPPYPAMRTLLACFKESKDQGFSMTFETSKYRLFKIINQHNPDRQPGGHDLAMIERHLYQWCGVMVNTNYFWDYDTDGNRIGRCDVTHGVLTCFKFPEYKKGERRKPGEITWDKLYFEKTLSVGNTKNLNFDKFFKLVTPLSQRTFQYADLKIMESKNNQHQKDALAVIRNHLGMTGKTYEKRPDKALAKFKPVMKEWKEKKILDFEIVPSNTESRHKFVFKPFRNKQAAVTKELPKTEKPPAPQTEPANSESTRSQASRSTSDIPSHYADFDREQRSIAEYFEELKNHYTTEKVEKLEAQAKIELKAKLESKGSDREPVYDEIRARTCKLMRADLTKRADQTII